jgi:hypothetical protein
VAKLADGADNNKRIDFHTWLLHLQRAFPGPSAQEVRLRRSSFSKIATFSPVFAYPVLLTHTFIVDMFYARGPVTAS